MDPLDCEKRREKKGGFSPVVTKSSDIFGQRLNGPIKFIFFLYISSFLSIFPSLLAIQTSEIVMLSFLDHVSVLEVVS